AAATGGEFSVTGWIILSVVAYLVLIYAISRIVEGSRRAFDRFITGIVSSAFAVAMVPLVSVAWTVITQKMLEEAGAKPEDATGIIQVLRGIRGVKVALVFEENAEGIKVGIRARDGARANVIAESFGGGGHVGAGGFTLQGTLEEVVERTLRRVYAELHDCGLQSA
ncbi:MAG: DHHA1 domain-containing protein, partial [Armatimonadota bacterium]|nr:DHHA1 domain-containing protein [Armatimonadota bacterium]